MTLHIGLKAASRFGSPVNFMGRFKPVIYFLRWNTKWNILKKNLVETDKNNNKKHSSIWLLYTFIFQVEWNVETSWNCHVFYLFYFFFTLNKTMHLAEGWKLLHTMCIFVLFCLNIIFSRLVLPFRGYRDKEINKCYYLFCFQADFTI